MVTVRSAACLAAALVVCVASMLSLTATYPRPAAAAASRPPADVKSGLVVLVQFPDIASNVPRSNVEQRFGQWLNQYVQEMSYDRVRFAIDVTERWYTLPSPVSRYHISSRNVDVDKSRVQAVITDALNAADRDIDLSRYDFVALFLGATELEYGMVGLCGWPGMLGFSHGAQESLRTRRGQLVKGGVAIFTSQAHLGTLFHDIAHVIGGVKDGKRMVPCLYDHDLQARPGPLLEVFQSAIVNMGFWDPMSCHFYKRTLPPPGLSSWTKLRLNWVDPAKVKVVKPGQTADLLLGPLEDASSDTLVIRIPLSQTSYYLIENRQPIGFDRNLPGHGVLIMRADDTVGECRHGQAPVRLANADPGQPRLEGAAFDLPARAVFTDRDRRIRVELIERVGNAYRIRISQPPSTTG